MEPVEGAGSVGVLVVSSPWTRQLGHTGREKGGRQRDAVHGVKEVAEGLGGGGAPASGTPGLTWASCWPG